MKKRKHFQMDEVRQMKVIICNNKRRGTGHTGDPIRIITEVFTLDGQLIAEYDSHKENKNK